MHLMTSTSHRSLLRRSTRLLVSLSMWLILEACGGSDSTMQEDTDENTSGGEATGSTATSGASGGNTWLPDTCSADQSPFLQESCLDSLRMSCNTHAEENECMATPVLFFDEGGYGIRCLWARVVKFSDASSCTVESVTGRCEASVNGECEDFCSGDFLLSDMSAISSQSELIQVCGGPLGTWSAVGAEQGYISTCGPNIQPPPPPLCDCGDAACGAR